MSAKEERSNYLCTDDDLNSLTDYFNAALTGEESKSRLQQMWEQEIGIIKATQRAAKQYELPACEPDKPYGIPSHPATKICTECRASKCCVLWDCPLRNEIWKAAQEKLMDELGLLHGEDAQRFNEQLDHPEPLTPEARDLVMQAKRITENNNSIPNSKELTLLAETDWHNREERKHRYDMIPWTMGWMTGFLSERKPYWPKMHEAAIRRDEREKVLDIINEENNARLKGLEILFATPADKRAELAQDAYLKEAYFELTLVKHLIESLRPTTPTQEPPHGP